MGLFKRKPKPRFQVGDRVRYLPDHPDLMPWHGATARLVKVCANYGGEGVAWWGVFDGDGHQSLVPEDQAELAD